MIVVDTNVLVALFNTQERQHAMVLETVGRLRETVVVSPYVVAELDYLIATRHGVANELTAMRALTRRPYRLSELDAAAFARALDVIEQYRDQNIGITDASLVVLAEKFHTKRILTLDRRHFDVLKPLDGGDFTLLP